MTRDFFTGSCHCGRIAFRVRGDLATAAVCNCSICVKKGYIHLIVLPGDFEIISGAEDLIAYRFHTHVAMHQFCKTCGVHPFYIPRSDPDKIDVNVRCLDNVDLDSLSPHRFDGDDWNRPILDTTSPGAARASPVLEQPEGKPPISIIGEIFCPHCPYTVLCALCREKLG